MTASPPKTAAPPSPAPRSQAQTTPFANCTASGPSFHVIRPDGIWRPRTVPSRQRTVASGQGRGWELEERDTDRMGDWRRIG
eukprot:2979538-Rhodomonas_salina.1